jgi:hypothetical protein
MPTTDQSHLGPDQSVVRRLFDAAGRGARLASVFTVAVSPNRKRAVTGAGSAPQYRQVASLGGAARRKGEPIAGENGDSHNYS